MLIAYHQRHYELKHRGYSLGRIAERVAKIYGTELCKIIFKGKQSWKVG